MNHDGQLDLVVTADATLGSADFVYVDILLGHGNATFAPASATLVASQDRDFLSPGSVALGDFNGDGNLDVAVLAPSSTSDYLSPSVLLGNGDGKLGTPRTVDAADTFAPSLAVADINRDGKLLLCLAKAHGS
jgi:hypothetical protein